MSKRTCIMLAALSALFALVALPGGALAATATKTLTVSPASSFKDIQSAITQIITERSGNPSTRFIYTIQVQANPNATYPSVSIDGTKNDLSDITIVGSNTKDTRISGGSGTAVSINGASNITIRHFTFTSGTAISVTGGGGLNITNNVFNVGINNVAINIATVSSANILNNTFYQNKTAIQTSSDVVIKNNIFSQNTNAILGSETTPNVTYNDFDPRTSVGFDDISKLSGTNIPNISQSSTDPQFVDAANKDFHLKPGSPAIGAGDPTIKNPDLSPSDMGAYGGPDAEPSIPQVEGVTAAVTKSGSTFSANLSWNAVSSSSVTGYLVHYGTASGVYNGTNATVGPSPVTVSGPTTTTFSLPGLTPTTVTSLSTPTITSITPANNSLTVHWTRSPGATNYIVFWNPDADFDEKSLPSTSMVLGDVQSATIPGLVNGKNYFVKVQASAQTVYFFAVGAVANGTEGPLSAEVSALIGDPVKSSLSGHAQETPSASVAYPILKGEGCFIATAAYGFYSSWQVQALRDFRDRYLLTNAPGRAFVAWYYHYGPIGAHYLNQHPALKPLVRVLLFPLVVGAIFLTATSALTKVAVTALWLLALTVLFRRRLAVRWGGVR